MLAIEAMDRLFREGLFDVFATLKKLVVDGGMVLVTGDLTIWDEFTINSQMNHKLIAEINAARYYATRLSQYATGAHNLRRIKLAALLDDPSAEKPVINSPPLAWIMRTKGKNDYRLHPEHTATIRLIFDVCIQGYSTRQIAGILNQRGIKPFLTAANPR